MNEELRVTALFAQENAHTYHARALALMPRADEPFTREYVVWLRERAAHHARIARIALGHDAAP